MPYLASELVDETGIALLREWISSLESKSNESQWADLKSELTSSTPRSLATKFLVSSSSALMLAHSLSDPAIAIPIKEKIARAATKSSNPLIAELFERFLPAEARTNLNQATARPEEILALRGDPERGAKLLHDSARLSCLQCHQFQSAGRAFGPAFRDAAKKKTREQLLDSILHPSREIAPEYVLYSVELIDDELLSGIVMNRAKDAITLRDPTGTDHPIPNSKIKSTRPQQLSAMPEGLLSGLSAQDVADIIDAIVSEAQKKE
jgi:putative heme-binding domain-containing protein